MQRWTTTRWMMLAAWCLAGTTPLAQAEHRVGNGGDAVVCRDAGGVLQSVELLDFYEVRTLGDDDLSLGIADMSAEARAVWALQRVARFDPVRAKRWTTAARQFFLEARLLANAQLVDIPDSSHLAYREGCTVEQLAIQRRPLFPGDKRYIIDADLWNALPREDQAGLILHEVLYGEALRLGQPDSIMTRHMTGILASSKLDGAIPAEWRAIVARVGFDAEHWLDSERAWRFALLPRPAGSTLREGQGQCATLAGEYAVPSIRKLSDAYARLAVSRLSDLLFDDRVENGIETVLWSSTVAGGTCGPNGERKIQALVMPAAVGPSRVEIVCETSAAPRTLCLSEYWADRVSDGSRGELGDDAGDRPGATDEQQGGD